MPRILILVYLCATLCSAQESAPGKGVNFYSIEKEIALGTQLAADFQRDTKPLDSPAALAYLNGIGQRLAAEIGGPPFTYTFAIVARDPTVLHEVEAFPGGFLFVPASIILTVKDANELAGVMAHAIAHAASRHHTRQATRATLVNTAAVPAIDINLEAGSRQPSLTSRLGLLQMWRKFELDADRLAVSKMPAAGYDARALARYINREQASYDDYSHAVFSSLPARAQRLEAISAVISELPEQVYPSHEGLEKIQDEVRRLTGSASPAKSH